METIIAQATPSGESAISVIRVSGHLSKEICKNACGYEKINSRIAKLANYHSVENKLIDQIVITFYQEGNSYTGQDSIEISCHGNPLISEWIIKDLLKYGCRLAEPGEFTKLAFLNGNIDLSQAEAVAQIIAAKNHTALEAAQRNLKGDLSNLLTKIQDDILNIQASIEAYIDFPEEDLGDENKKEYIRKIDIITRELKNLLDQSDKLNLFKKNLRVSLIGLPNAGKSSLFNELLGKDRALVSSVKGTTRDYLEMNLKFDDTWITLIDTAGIHDSSNDLEIEGIKRSYNQIDEADIILWVVDVSSHYPTEELNKIKSVCGDKTIILVKNKIDLGEFEDSIDYQQKLVVEVSCTTKLGIGNLKEILSELINNTFGYKDEKVLYIGERHKQLIQNCLQSISESKRNFESDIGIEIISSDLTTARINIDQIIGAKTNEDMLDKLFGEFCIGK
jgi:tRNA modification GTPase